MSEITDCSFLTKLDNKWQLTQELQFKTRYGLVVVPAGFTTDLYSVVPNSKYPDFWKASVLHDWAYMGIRSQNPQRVISSKFQADIAFYDEMLIQSAIIFGKLQEYVGTEVAVDEFRKLLRTSKTYYAGVAGWVGRVYQFFAD